MGYFQNNLAYTLEATIAVIGLIACLSGSQQADDRVFVDTYFHFISYVDFTRDIDHTDQASPASSRSQP
jgi:hypothetical protein